MLGFASTVMASWEVLLVLFKLTLLTGGLHCKRVWHAVRLREHCRAGFYVRNNSDHRESDHPSDNVAGRLQLEDNSKSLPM
jgi:hypothetical protein